MSRLILLPAVLCIAAFADSAAALAGPVVPVPVVSYSMPNGSGQASGGSFNYWDRFYDGIGSSTMVDGALLSGGRGDLTDGIVAGGIWNTVENSAGTGPYVGWRDFRTPEPAIDFQLGSYASPGRFIVTGISLHIDNSKIGGVHAPGEILVNGIAASFAAPAPGTIGWVALSGFGGLDGRNPLNLTLRYDVPGWIFVSEVAFSGIWVPEPGTWALLIAGFGMVGTSLRRARKQAAA
jgi:hypothetical protein